MPHATIPELKITPIKPGPSSKVKFGATVEGIDLNDLAEDDFLRLRDAIYTHQLVIIKNQQALTPNNHFNFVHRFDPVAPAMHGHGSAETMKKQNNGNGSLLARGSVYNIPGTPGVRLIAAGYQGKDHYGLKDIDFKASTVLDTHADPPTKEDLDAGFTRFGRWHIDFPGYISDPPMITESTLPQHMRMSTE